MTVVALDPRPEHALTRPDAFLGLASGGETVAEAALWWSPPLVLPESGSAGRIGHVRWRDAETGTALLRACADRLREAGSTRALGPLDGSTWFSYRVVSDEAPAGVTHPPFASEPWQPTAVGRAFEEAGFAPVAHYLSSVVDALPDESEQAAADRARLADAGIHLRAFDPGHAQDELASLHGLLLRAFAGNPYYAPLDEERFQALYGPLVAQVDPELVLIAEHERQRVGVLLAFPDAAQAARGEAIDTVVVKTLAVDPGWRGKGLGGALVRIGQEAARQKGYRRAIHALMHAENASVRISRHLGRPMRSYALLGRHL